MGRPLNKKYFGNRNIGSASTTADNGIGGQGLASVTIAQGTGKTAGAQAVTITAPALPNGIQATATASVTASTVAITITEPGSGYTVIPTVTVAGGGTGYTFTAVLTTSNGIVGTSEYQEPAISISAWTLSSAAPGDIIKQVNDTRYKVTTAQGTAQCKLVAAAPAAIGEMTITATDSASNSYYVTKLTSHRAVLTRANGGTTHEFATGSSATWTFGTAIAKVSVKIANA